MLYLANFQPFYVNLLLFFLRMPPKKEALWLFLFLIFTIRNNKEEIDKNNWEENKNEIDIF